MGIFDGINKASATKGGAYLEPGEYLVLIHKCQMFKPRTGGDAFIVELEVLESRGGSPERPPSPVGYKPSWYVDFKHDAALGNVASFMRPGIVSLSAQKYGKVVAEESLDLEQIHPLITGEQNLLGGVQMAVRVLQVMKKAGKGCPKCVGTPCKEHAFSRHDWSSPTVWVSADRIAAAQAAQPPGDAIA